MWIVTNITIFCLKCKAHFFDHTLSCIKIQQHVCATNSPPQRKLPKGNIILLT